MSGRPAMLREREIKRVIAVAKKAGAEEVELGWGEVKATIRLNGSDEKPAADVNEWLEGDDAA